MAGAPDNALLNLDAELYETLKNAFSNHQNNPIKDIETLAEARERTKTKKIFDVQQEVSTLLKLDLAKVFGPTPAAEESKGKEERGQKASSDKEDDFAAALANKQYLEKKLEEQKSMIKDMFLKQINYLNLNREESELKIAELRSSRSRDRAVMSEEKDLLAVCLSSQEIANSGIKLLEDLSDKHARQMKKLLHPSPLPAPKSQFSSGDVDVTAGPSGIMTKPKDKSTAAVSTFPEDKKGGGEGGVKVKSNVVVVKNVAKQTTESQIRLAFGQYGVVRWVSIDKENRQAHVKLTTYGEADQAMSKLDGSKVDGKFWKLSLDPLSQQLE